MTPPIWLDELEPMTGEADPVGGGFALLEPHPRIRVTPTRRATTLTRVSSTTRS